MGTAVARKNVRKPLSVETPVAEKKKGAETSKVQVAEDQGPEKVSEVPLWYKKLGSNLNLILGLFLSVFVFCFILFLLGSRNSGTSAHGRSVASFCTTQKQYIVCHTESCNLKGACQATSKNVVFDSIQCANAVRTVTIHLSNGVVKHYPAYYLRLYNTTSFSVDGKRVLFSPASPSCHAISWPRKVNQVERVVSNRLQGSVVWVTSEKFKRFSLYKGNHLVAVMDEDMVLVEQVGPTHFVYRFDLACRHWEEEVHSLSVFAEAGQKKKEVEAFNYCN